MTRYGFTPVGDVICETKDTRGQPPTIPALMISAPLVMAAAWLLWLAEWVLTKGKRG